MWAGLYVSLFGRVLAEIIQKFAEYDTNYFTHFKSHLKGVSLGLCSMEQELDICQVDFWGKKKMIFFADFMKTSPNLYKI